MVFTRAPRCLAPLVSRVSVVFIAPFLGLAVQCSASPFPEANGAIPTKVTIGIAVALTGNAAPFGSQELKGATLAAEELSRSAGVQIALKVEDTQSTNIGTLTAVRRLIEVDGADLIVGPTWLDSFQGVLPIAAKYGALLITPSAEITNFKAKASDYPLTFSSYFSVPREVTALLEHIEHEGHTTIAVVTDHDPYCEGVKTLARQKASTSSHVLAEGLSFDPGESDFRALLGRVRSFHADAALFCSVDERSVLSFLKQRQELNPKPPLFGLHDLDAFSGNSSFVGVFANLTYSVPVAPLSQFQEAFRLRFQIEPGMTSVHAYDALKMLAEALASGVRSAEEVSDYLHTHEFRTESFGRVKFSALGGIETGEFRFVSR